MIRSEKFGLGIATAGHVLLFGLLSVGFLKKPEPLKLNNPPMDVSIVDEVALHSSAPVIAPEAPPPSEAPEVGPSEQAAPAPQPDPAPRPRLVEPVKPLPAPKPVEKPAPLKKAATAKPSPAKPAPAKPVNAKAVLAKPAAKPDAKTAGEAGAATATRGSKLNLDPSKWLKSDGGTGATPAAKPVAGTPAATIGPAQKAALDAEIRRQIKPFWKAPSGADVELLRTTVDVELAKDGSIIGSPEVVDTAGVTASNKGQVRLHQEQAVKAVRLAAPFNLPAGLYPAWKSLRISFDKRLSQ